MADRNSQSPVASHPRVRFDTITSDLCTSEVWDTEAEEVAQTAAQQEEDARRLAEATRQAASKASPPRSGEVTVDLLSIYSSPRTDVDDDEEQTAASNAPTHISLDILKAAREARSSVSVGGCVDSQLLTVDGRVRRWSDAPAQPQFSHRKDGAPESEAEQGQVPVRQARDVVADVLGKAPTELGAMPDPGRWSEMGLAPDPDFPAQASVPVPRPILNVEDSRVLPVDGGHDRGLDEWRRVLVEDSEGGVLKSVHRAQPEDDRYSGGGRWSQMDSYLSGLEADSRDRSLSQASIEAMPGSVRHSFADEAPTAQLTTHSDLPNEDPGEHGRRGSSRGRSVTFLSPRDVGTPTATPTTLETPSFGVDTDRGPSNSRGAALSVSSTDSEMLRAEADDRRLLKETKERIRQNHSGARHTMFDMAPKRKSQDRARSPKRTQDDYHAHCRKHGASVGAPPPAGCDHRRPMKGTTEADLFAAFESLNGGRSLLRAEARDWLRADGWSIPVRELDGILDAAGPKPRPGAGPRSWKFEQLLAAAKAQGGRRNTSMEELRLALLMLTGGRPSLSQKALGQLAREHQRGMSEADFDGLLATMGLSDVDHLDVDSFAAQLLDLVSDPPCEVWTPSRLKEGNTSNGFPVHAR